MYVEFLDGTLGATRNPQRVETKLSDGTALGRPADGWQDRQLETLGLYPVAHVAKPADTSTNTHDVTVALGTPGDPTTATQVWTSRLFTAQENDDAAAVVAAAAAAVAEQAQIDGAAQISSATATRFRGYGATEPDTDLVIGDVFFKEA